VAKWTKRFCYQDWVVERFGNNRDGKAKKQRHLVDVPPFDGSVPYPGRRHRADKEKKQYTITAGFVMSWVVILILQGAHIGVDKQSASKLWREQPYGTSIPYLKNATTWDAYVFMRQYIYFVNNETPKPKGEVGYDALFKVKYALDEMMKGA